MCMHACVCVFMCVCARVCVCLCMCARACVCLCVCEGVSVCIYVWVREWVCVFMCARVCVFMCARVCMCVYVCGRVCVFMCARACEKGVRSFMDFDYFFWTKTPSSLVYNIFLEFPVTIDCIHMSHVTEVGGRGHYVWGHYSFDASNKMETDIRF